VHRKLSQKRAHMPTAVTQFEGASVRKKTLPEAQHAMLRAQHALAHLSQLLHVRSSEAQSAVNPKPALNAHTAAAPMDPLACAAVRILTTRPQAHEVPPAEARANAAFWPHLQGPGRPCARVRDMLVAGCAQNGGRAVPVRVYWPLGARIASSSSPPLLLFLHGGGFIMGGLDSHDAVARCLACESSCVVVAAEYALAPEQPHPAALNDALAVAFWARAAAPGLGADGSRMAVAGDSAGGCLAAALALACRDTAGAPTLRFQALIYPVLDARMGTPSYQLYGSGAHGLSSADMAYFWSAFLGRGSSAPPFKHAPATAQPSLAKSLAKLPPALVITAEFDVLRDEAEQYGARMAAAGVPVTVSRFDGMMHGFLGSGALFPAGARALTQAAGAIRGALGAQPMKLSVSDRARTAIWRARIALTHCALAAAIHAWAWSLPVHAHAN
jgi:acetyl esterase